MADNVLAIPPYDPRRGVVAPTEGGSITIEIRDGVVEIFGDPAGLRDLARWCLALSDHMADSGAHVHLDAGVVPLTVESMPLMLARDPLSGTAGQGTAGATVGRDVQPDDPD